MKIYYEHFCSPFYRNKLNKIFLTALNKANIDYKGFSVNISVVTEDEIKNLNAKFRNTDKVTDVLSFPNIETEHLKHFNAKSLSKEINLEDGLISLGDIAICKNIVKKQAKAYEHSYKREFCFLALHGFLHLLGFDHQTPEEEQEMQAIAREVLNQNKVRRKRVKDEI